MLSNALVRVPARVPVEWIHHSHAASRATPVCTTRASDIEFRMQGRSRDAGDRARPLRRLRCEPCGGGVARDAAPRHNGSLTEERRRGMLKKIAVWGAALAVIVVAVLLVMRVGPGDAPDVVAVAGASAAAAADQSARDLGRAAAANPAATRAGRRRGRAEAAARRRAWRAGARRCFRRLATFHVRLRERRRLHRANVARASDGVFAADSRRRVHHASADRSRFWRALRGRRSGFLEPRRRRDFRGRRSVVRRLHVESRRGADPPRRAAAVRRSARSATRRRGRSRSRRSSSR